MMKESFFHTIKLIAIPILIFLTACGALPPRSGPFIPQTTTLTPNVPITGAGPSVAVKDQTTDGTSVDVEDVVSQGPGWMVIHNQVNGTVGDPIGETPVNNGDNKNVVVKIDPTKATGTMYAMLHMDAGIVGKYEFPGPDVPVMVNGAMLSPAFNATIQAASMGTATPDMGMSMTTPAINGNTPLVKVSDQALNGNSVMVDDVVSSGSGWIVIYTTNAQGQPDQAIGHAAVKDGDNPDVMVQVDPSKAQGTLDAQLQVDQGTVGTFEYPGPDQPVMMGVQMIAGTFKILIAAQAGSNSAATPMVLQPSVTVKDQEVVNGTVTIPQVVSNGNWWLVIHRQDSNGTMGEYIGQTQIKNGINTNVVVKINLSLATPVLYAMLHEDNPPVGILEFPGSDTPVFVNGQMVAPAFNVSGLTQDITINIHKVSDTVSFLTDSDGRSLYISLKDTSGKSNCTGDCLKVWQPLLAKGRVLAGAGVAQANLGILLLPSGDRQVTYLGLPLYTYSKDVNPGDTGGQGIDGVWFLVTP
jgi:predicted lipoprotein with Yx(FWY)xxD motif